ncbi:lipopolysaccharide assembly protein LapA domain-containing protein [Bacteroidota bacterium]
MKLKIVVIILIVILIAIFAIQNTEIVNVKLWFWEVQTPRAILILLCITVGLFIGFIVPSPSKKENTVEKE